MLDHTGINVADFERSKAFYRAALAPLGYRLAKEKSNSCGFGAADPSGRVIDPGGDFWIFAGTPHEPRVHVAFNAATRAEVDAFHAAALAAGGRDNGAPGLRPHYHPDYYGAFVLDPDGYNVEAVCHTSER